MAFDLNENSSVEDVSDWLNSNGFEDFGQTFHGMYIFIFSFARKFQIRPATWPNSDDKNFRIFICLSKALYFSCQQNNTQLCNGNSFNYN